FGSYGGAILGTTQLRKKILQKSPLFVGSTPVPLPMAASALAGLRVLKNDRGLRRRLTQNRDYVREASQDFGVEVVATPGPILAFFPKNARDSARWQKELLRTKIFPPIVRYPGGPAGGYFRFMISSEHTRAQLNNLIEVLSRLSTGSHANRKSNQLDQPVSNRQSRGTK